MRSDHFHGLDDAISNVMSNQYVRREEDDVMVREGRGSKCHIRHRAEGRNTYTKTFIVRGERCWSRCR